jgi:hypothetical protein
MEKVYAGINKFDFFSNTCCKYVPRDNIYQTRAEKYVGFLVSRL